MVLFRVYRGFGADFRYRVSLICESFEGGPDGQTQYSMSTLNSLMALQAKVSRTFWYSSNAKTCICVYRLEKAQSQFAVIEQQHVLVLYQDAGW